MSGVLDLFIEIRLSVLLQPLLYLTRDSLAPLSYDLLTILRVGQPDNEEAKGILLRENANHLWEIHVNTTPYQPTWRGLEGI